MQFQRNPFFEVPSASFQMFQGGNLLDDEILQGLGVFQRSPPGSLWGEDTVCPRHPGPPPLGGGFKYIFYLNLHGWLILPMNL